MSEQGGALQDAAAPSVEKCVLRSGLRSGIKRELAFAVKSQAEISPMSRTRSGKIRRFSPSSDAAQAATARRAKRSGSGQERAFDEKKNNLLAGLAAVSPIVIDQSDDDERRPSGPQEASGPRTTVDDSRASEVAVSVVGKTELELDLESAVPMDVQNELKLANTDPVHVLTEVNEENVAAMDAQNDGNVESMVTTNSQYELNVAQNDMNVGQSVSVDAQNEQKLENAVATDAQTEPNVETAIATVSQNELKVENGVAVDDQNELKVENSVSIGGQTELKVENGAVADCQKEQNKQEKPTRRFTRSLLKSNGGKQQSSVEVSSASISTPVKGGSVSEAVTKTSLQDDRGTEVKIVSLTPMRRFTRSLSKTKTEEPPPIVEVASAATSSEGSDDSDEQKSAKDLRTTPKKKMELKMSKKIALTKLPTNIKELLSTGLLEGLAVKYVPSGEKQGLGGVIKKCKIICSCSSCKGIKAVSVFQFEQHAGSSKKNPAEFIYLENGSTIHDVLTSCTSAPLDMLESTIQNAISSEASIRFSTCQQCNGSFRASRVGKLSSICDTCLVERLSPVHQSPSSVTAKKTRLTKSTLITNSGKSAKNPSSEIKSAQRRVTTKDLWLHKLVFMNDTLPDGTEVAYYARGKRLLEGYIKGSGIFCRCCNTVVSPSQFEAHAGYSQRRKPYLNIYTSNGVSLHELSVSLSKDKKFSARENDDLCRICSDGGDLLLCDLCPRAFHKECVGLSSIPKGDWYCPCCETMHQREEYVARNNNAIAAGRVSGVDPIEQIFKRCIRIVQSSESEASSCVLCSGHDFSKSGFGPRTVLICDQCEKEFHIGCLKSHNIADLKELPKGKWFCCSDCSSIHSALQKFLSLGSRQLPEFLVDVIRRKRIEKGLSGDNSLDIRWRLLNGKVSSPDSRLLLSKVVAIFQESFDPIIDLATGQDIIPAMVYGRDMRHQDFGGIYCAVLTINSTVVSAGILRVLGRDVAELPLVATTMGSQGHGCFQSLFSCIESLLDSLDVKHLVLPATKEAEGIWLTKFGFHEINLKQMEEYTKGARPMSFQGTPMLHKLVPNSKIQNFSV